MIKATNFLILALLATVAGDIYTSEYSKSCPQARRFKKITWDSEDGLKILSTATLCGMLASGTTGEMTRRIYNWWFKEELSYQDVLKHSAPVGALLSSLYGGVEGLQRANILRSCEQGIKKARESSLALGCKIGAIIGSHNPLMFLAFCTQSCINTNVARIQDLVNAKTLNKDEGYELLDLCDKFGISVYQAYELFCLQDEDDFLESRYPFVNECNSGWAANNDDNTLCVVKNEILVDNSENACQLLGCDIECDMVLRCIDCTKECSFECNDESKLADLRCLSCPRVDCDSQQVDECVARCDDGCLRIDDSPVEVTSEKDECTTSTLNDDCSVECVNDC